jgi:hypothetical protein
VKDSDAVANLTTVALLGTRALESDERSEGQEQTECAAQRKRNQQNEEWNSRTWPHAICAREQENGPGWGSNFSAQEWEPLTDHRETKTLGGKSKTQARNTENETNKKKLLLLWLHEQAVGNKIRRERETPNELMIADTKIGQIEARLQNQKPDLDLQTEK